MSYNDQFFNYRPTGVGIVFDLDGLDNLRAAKNALVGLLISLNDAEDKAVVYGAKHHVSLPHSLGQTVGDISNYKEPADFNMASGLSLVASNLNQMYLESYRFVFYFVDRYSDSQIRRFERVVAAAVVDEMEEVRFVVFDMGDGSPGLEEVCERRRQDWVKVSSKELTADLLKEVIDGKD